MGNDNRAIPASDGGGDRLRPGIDLLLTIQVAKRPDVNVNERTVLRWIEKGLHATLATKEEIAELVRGGYLNSIPSRGIYLIQKSDLGQIPRFRAYPTGTKRSRRGKAT